MGAVNPSAVISAKGARLSAMKKPIMRAIDKTFDWGRIGFGSFDDTGRVRNIRLYAPESRKSNAGDPFVEGRK